MNYAKDYLYAVIYGDCSTPPDETQAGEYFDGLLSLWKARQKGLVHRLWQTLKGKRPEWVKLIETPALDPKEHTEPLNLEFIRTCLDLQETGDANLLEALYKDSLRYDWQTERWHLWAGHHWQRDEINLVRKLLSGNVRAQYYAAASLLSVAAANAPTPEEKTRFEAHIELCNARARAVCNVQKKKRVLEEAQTNLGMKGREFDANPWLLGCVNGTVDLRTGGFAPGKPSDYIRTVCPTLFEGLDAPAPRFEQFILEIFDHDQGMAGFMQRLLGYGLIGAAREHILPILYGEEGRNGKDTLLETIGAVLGSGLASTGSSDLLIARKEGAAGSASPHIIDLLGARLKWVSETSENAQMNANQVKMLTGGGKIKARALHSNLIEFEPRYLLLLLTNHKPRVTGGGDAALWARLLLIPFTLRFVENPTAHNERQRDPDLKEKLRSEPSGILAWLIKGCLAYQEQGLCPPDKVKLATDEYQGEEDVFNRFLEDECLQGDGYHVGSTQLYEAFCQSTGSKISQTKFGLRLTRKGFEKSRTTGGKYIYKGIGLRADSEGVNSLNTIL